MPHIAAAKDRRNGHLAMLTFSCLVAGSFSLGAMAANEITPLALNGVRFVAAAIFVGIMAMATGGIPRASLRQPWRYAILGGIFALYFVMMFVGLKTAEPVSASAVFTLTPLLAAGFGYLIMRQITTRRIALALATGAVGALWVIFRGDIHAFLAFHIGRGEALYFIGVVAHALYTPLVPRLHRGERTLVFTFFILSAASLAILLLGWRDVVETDWAHLPAIVWIALGYITVFATTTSATLLAYASVRLAAAKVMAYTYLVPSWVIIWEILLGHGTPPALVFGGIGLTVLALYLLLKHEA
ncbi:DMT family transporter [Celeribacter halophilus]|uniref:DMT family transporter n=1 Tax=Celeribacter halophilus TaxID=576117 RepID=A0A1I3V0G3_9RHOB|nr:DMT family transporter [Celeribacter halophilus]MDO6456459.1 DMT family transporter [Celeribacter halophilus]MDO6510523.1 DMT family transporter [Celeribacter halophilus]MDO6722922.1 DMT family transporter [Celeribacter halophilus]PZX09728.1 EamA-like transporter family protein [Celeribacter halophilus]SFJ88918.1 EamA-like transporter family protein [Celeribacter halophilus]